MNRKDQLNGTVIRPGAPTSGGPSDGSTIESDSDATNGTFVGIIDRSSIDRVAP